MCAKKALCEQLESSGEMDIALESSSRFSLCLLPPHFCSLFFWGFLSNLGNGLIWPGNLSMTLVFTDTSLSVL